MSAISSAVSPNSTLSALLSLSSRLSVCAWRDLIRFLDYARNDNRGVRDDNRGGRNENLGYMVISAEP